MLKTIVAAILLLISTAVFAAEKLSVQQAGNYLVKRSTGAVVNSPGFTGTTQYFAQYNDAVSLAATTSRACGGCDIWITQPSLKVNMVSDAPAVVTITATVTDRIMNVTWTAPTTRANGAALTQAEIGSYVLTIMQGSTVLKTIVTPDNTVLAELVPLQPGSYTMWVVCIDTKGTPSLPSTNIVVTVN